MSLTNLYVWLNTAGLNSPERSSKRGSLKVWRIEEKIKSVCIHSQDSCKKFHDFRRLTDCLTDPVFLRKGTGLLAEISSGLKGTGCNKKVEEK